MALNIPQASSTDPLPEEEHGSAGPGTASLAYFVFALFFIFGGITSLNDVIIPKLKGLFTLTYGQAMLVQSAYFAAYFIVSIPAALIVRRIGYMRGAVVGLLTMMAGCLLFVPASSSGRFAMFLGALFVLASGVTIVQVVANPLISMLGNPRTAHSRLTFAQAFNSLGTTLFPYFGSILILGSIARIEADAGPAYALDAHMSAESHVIVVAYLGIALALVVIAALVWMQRNKLREARADHVSILGSFDLLKRPRFAFGVLGIFVYVGAEVAIGSLLVNFLMQPDVLGLAEVDAGKHVPFYWGGAMVGRFAGAWFLRRFAPGKVLATVAIAALLLLAVAAETTGAASGWALLAVGLANAIMFPTIFSLACEGLGDRAAEGSGLICMAIVGGAIVPWVTGHMADATGLHAALIIPAICYAAILAFGLYARRSLIG
ncbi:sugar MFS transporter [Sphingomonas crocodyli]|uniref:Sugar MFS transporter n=1 Tax=Sphingomonas crocodyli TaxID=1979270 RepID=A0A437LWP4_9SPHN|nr:sugar MFS transporter [Sphingomonas crocodyli]RVT89786.1 sugar MFS transporter [Sphingomonas crocodyli]